ncbi:MAG: sialidase family protein [Kiritimatiellales bacterium]
MKTMLSWMVLTYTSVVFGEVTYLNLFVSGNDGYNTYRIPALITAADGTVLAFCEGRRDGKGDTGKIDLIIKRSMDGGKNWSDQTVIWADGDNTCGNPCAVMDENTGRIFLFSTWNLGSDHERDIMAGTSADTRRVFYLTSDDHGVTWSKPVEITSSAKRNNWRWYATGPGTGIQLKYGMKKGRLIIPANHSFNLDDGTSIYGAHVIYSDDGGKNWQIGDSVVPGANESQSVELLDGTLVLNSRNHLYRGTRIIARSPDGGERWTNVDYQSNLIEPRCQAGFIRYSPNKFSAENILLFSNPAESKRIRMTIKASADEGQTWNDGLMLHSGPSAYSSLAVLPDGGIGCCFEAGEKGPYEKIIFSAVSRLLILK